MNRRNFVKAVAAGTVALAVGVTTGPEPDISSVVDAPLPTVCPVTGEKLAPHQLCTVDGWRDVLFADLKKGDMMRTWFNPTGWGDPYQVIRVIDRGSLFADPVGFPSDDSWAELAGS